MNKNSYIAVFIGLVVVVLFFIVSGFGLPFGGGLGVTSGQNANLPDFGSPNTSQSGLIVQDIIVGEGDEAISGKVLTVHYAGALEDGSIFDSSVARGEPFEFILGSGQVIPGWDQGLQGMRVGGQRALSIPPELAYGDQGIWPIPPNATLIFEVELLAIES